MKFKYFKFPLQETSEIFGKAILKPIIPIDIKADQGRPIIYAALIDSGADFCIFDAQIGKLLGLKIENGIRNEFGGIQDRGGAVAYMHKVIINIGGWDYETVVGFSDDIAAYGYGILGQKGFFDIFTVKFDLAKEEIELKEKK